MCPPHSHPNRAAHPRTTSPLLYRDSSTLRLAVPMKRCKARFPQSRARCAAAALALAVVAGVGFTAVRAHRRAARLRKRTTATRRPVSTTERAIYEIHRKLSGAMKVCPQDACFLFVVAGNT